jgi:hypothetical protein
MRLFKHFLFSFALIGAGTSLSAQGGLGTANFMNYFSNDSLNSTDTLHFYVVTSNTSSPGNNFVGTLDYNMYNDTMNTGGNNLFPILQDSIDNITLAPGDTVSWNSMIQLNVHQNCKSGINTVVIWPVARPGSPSPLPTVDSLRHDIFIIEPTGLRKSVQEGTFVVGPNPFSDRIDIICKGQNIVERVRILDMRGAVVYENLLPKKSWIETSMLAQGVYYVEIAFTDGRKTIVKTIKQ